MLWECQGDLFSQSCPQRVISGGETEARDRAPGLGLF